MTNSQFIQTISYLFAIAIAKALPVLVFAKDILALLPFCVPSTAAPECPRITVAVKVEVQYSMIEPLSLVSSDSTFGKVSSECYSGPRIGKRSCLF
ncbi:hypothetical protein ARMGADRAFT_1008298 [Armillaria gallica]|uniref:Uncharacterized protein n=1 Tax=Armillaria gallica TaxID=47427 RepID=A0A2H3EF56_ARMGA|nr:hypothetical protein ARMGADRAFT_1008298 [Armillaria gallica]